MTDSPPFIPSDSIFTTFLTSSIQWHITSAVEAEMHQVHSSETGENWKSGEQKWVACSL